VVVATGQQVGLFSGPAYSIYKALTAVRLARELSSSGLEAVPVFWLASEDHDFAEVNHCWVFDAAGQPVRIEAPAPGALRRPVGGIPVAAPAVEQLRQALSGHPWGEDIAALAGEAYADSATFASGFHRLLARLLEAYGLLILDPLQPAMRRLMAPLLERALRTAPELNRRLRERDAELAPAGYHSQVRVEEDTSLLFLLEKGKRLTVRLGDERLTPEKLAARAEDLSPNALLRPVVQDYVLPTVAGVFGPAEVAYVAQAQVLYRELLGRMPVAVPRWGATLVDSRSARLMDRYGLTLPDFFHGEEAVRGRIAARLVPAQVRHQLDDAESRTGRLLDELGTTLTGFDPTLAAALDKSRRKILYQLSKVSAKTARETLRRNERAGADAAYLTHLLWPHRHPQERFYSILPFLARHGPDLIARLYAELRPDSPAHRVVLV
jgi:bacillithiol biosynthesis cysteine-adding enzyme BshC